ncbi:hypothetical protein, partial [Curtobacterium pusillum]|uniref:hypothetical protein n=1 Tax=Curtobacterium pusillum TaxID=69373 RepID=UPI0016436FF7
TGTTGQLTTAITGTSTAGAFIAHTTTPTRVSDFFPATVTTEQYNAGVTNTFTGTATPNSTLRILNASGTELVKDVQVDAKGAWSFSRMMSASAAHFEFKIEQTKDGKTNTSELFRVTAVKAWQDAKVNTEYVSSGVVNTFTGTGTPGATLRILNVSNTQIVNNTIRVGEDGKWTFTRGISNDAENFRMKIEQNLGGETRTSALFTINAAPIAKASSTGPAKIVPGAINTFTGTVDPSATVRILNGSGTQIVDPADVTIDKQGNYTFDRTVSSNATEFRFKIEQTKDGHIRTSNVFTIKK